MSVLPSQKLTIGELFVSMAVGLILYLLPNDIRNQTTEIWLSESMVFLAAFIITGVFLFIIKRYEAVGAALLTNALITAGSFGFGIINGILTKGEGFWPSFSEYQLISMLILWVVPFLFVVLLRLTAKDQKDTNDTRRSFCRFLSLSLRAMMILYIMVVVFVQILPHMPSTSVQRSIYYVPFTRIQECLDNAAEWGTLYLCWNGLLLMPLSFSLLILNPKIRWWQILFISFAAGLALEIFQFSFSTGTVYVDDILLYLAGGMIGVFIKRLIDYIRSFITVGQDRTMLSLDFTPVGGLDENDENDDDEEEMEQEENLSSDLRESLPLGSEADDALDDTIDNPVTLPTHTDTLSS